MVLIDQTTELLQTEVDQMDKNPEIITLMFVINLFGMKSKPDFSLVEDICFWRVKQGYVCEYMKNEISVLVKLNVSDSN